MKSLAPSIKKGLLLVVALFVLGAVVYGGVKVTGWGQKIFQKNSPLSFFASFGQLFSAKDRPIAGEEEGRVNILLLGIGGEGHEGANLTDTVIVASIKPKPTNGEGESEVSLFSIPRDFVVRLPDGLEWRKINSAYAYGELKQPGLGAKWVIEAAEKVLGERIPFYAVADFAGFRKAIDDLGGVDVLVERGFSDSYFPDYRKGYLPTIKFQEGWQHMDGERALQFARSRHGTNNEGSDYARSRRQQKILAATKEKAGKLKLSSLSTINKLLNNFADHFKTNLEPWEIKRLYDLSRDIKTDSIYALSLDPSTGVVCNEIAQETGAYVLTYCPGKTSADVRQFFAQRFTWGKLYGEVPRILVQNSTKIPGLAQRAEIALKAFSFEVTSENFPDQQEYAVTTVYDFTNGKKPKTAKYLEETLAAFVASSPYPFSENLTKPVPDFVVVLGKDAPEKVQRLLAEIQTKPAVIEPTASDNKL